jgi:hypothetical protein
VIEQLFFIDRREFGDVGESDRSLGVKDEVPLG